MKFTENLLTNIQLSKMLHLEIPNITKAVAKHMSLSKTCHHVPTLIGSTRLTSSSCNQNPSSNEDNVTIVTRSRASEIDWTSCIFCIHKAFKDEQKNAQSFVGK
jgi:hypothetical protein